jgi:hypothetical protein
VAGGLLSTLAIAALWHVLGRAKNAGASYPYTQYLNTCISWAAAFVFLAVSGILGWTFRQTWRVAAGMVTPWLVALLIEVIHDAA